MLLKSFFQRQPDPGRVLCSLGLDDHFTLDELVVAVAKKRGRPLQMKMAWLLPEFSALWIRNPQRDYIVTGEGLTETQRGHAIVHELSHMLLGHKPGIVTTPKQLEDALNIPREMEALARSACQYKEKQEAEAEALATAITLRLLRSGETQETEECAMRFAQYLG